MTVVNTETGALVPHLMRFPSAHRCTANQTRSGGRGPLSCINADGAPSTYQALGRAANTRSLS